MSRRSVQKFTAAPPKPPPATQAGDEVSRFHGGVVAWMGQMALAYNRNIENTQRDRASTATVIPFYDSSGVPNVVYYCINAFLHDDGLLHAVEKQKSAWALRFDLTGDLFEVLYCAALTDPIVWTSYLSVSSAGAATISGYVPVTRTVNGHALSADVTVTKGDVGLGNADNTSDVNKPVSTATQTALNLKQDLDADLTALAALSSTGVVKRTGAGAFSAGSLSSGDIPDLSASYAPASLIDTFSGVGASGTDGTTTSTSFTRINHTISGQNGIQYTNSSGRTKTVLARVVCSVSSDGTHTSWFRLNATGTGVSVTRQGGVRTSSGVYVPAMLEILLTVTTGNTVTIFIEAEVAAGGTAYLVETGDDIWTMIGQATG